jgi:plastocyanin
MSHRIFPTWLPFVAAALLFAVLLAGCTGAPSGQPPATTQATPAMTTPPATTAATTAVPSTTAQATTVVTTVPPTTMAAPTTTVSPPPVAVTIQAFLFSPASVEVPRGTTVTWTNQDSAPHTVVSDMTQEFASPTLGMGQSFSFTFTKAGSYPYHCSIHPTMHGNVIVT